MPQARWASRPRLAAHIISGKRITCGLCPVSQQDCVGSISRSPERSNRGLLARSVWALVWPTFYPGAFRTRNHLRPTEQSYRKPIELPTNVSIFQHPLEDGLKPPARRPPLPLK